jgi:hypothetical protein
MGAPRHLLDVAMLCALFVSAASFTDPPDGEYPDPSFRRLRQSSTHPVRPWNALLGALVSSPRVLDWVPSACVNVVACMLSGARL